MSDLIVVKQLPIIEEKLKEVNKQILQEVEEAKGLVCTEETVKIVKEKRTKLNNTFKTLEEERKTVKNAVLEPYNKFEETYKEYVSNVFKSADMELKQKINSVESELKAKKEQEIKEYFEEYKTANNIDFITYEQARINVTLTASKKSLKEQVKTFIDKIVDDLNLIEIQEHESEILVEYKQTLNVSHAITTVTNRIKAIEEEKRKQEEQKIVHIESNENHEITKESYEQLEKAFSKQPEQPKEKIFTITFTVKGTAPKLKQLKDYLLREGYQYE